MRFGMHNHSVFLYNKQVIFVYSPSFQPTKISTRFTARILRGFRYRSGEQISALTLGACYGRNRLCAQIDSCMETAKLCVILLH
jgi:hypothetical protein